MGLIEDRPTRDWVMVARALEELVEVVATISPDTCARTMGLRFVAQQLKPDTVLLLKKLVLSRDLPDGYIRARMVEPDWQGGIAPLQEEIRSLRLVIQGGSHL